MYNFTVKVTTKRKENIVYNVKANNRAESIKIAMQYIIDNDNPNDIVSVRSSVQEGRGKLWAIDDPNDIHKGDIN